MKQRFQSHVGRNTPKRIEEKDLWINELKSLGLLPIMEELESGNDYWGGDIAEISWIKFFYDCGYPLINRPFGKNWSGETMKRVINCFPEPQIQALRAMAKERDVSVSELIRRAIDVMYMNKKPSWLMPSIADLRQTTAEKRHDAIDHARMLVAWHKGEYGEETS